MSKLGDWFGAEVMSCIIAHVFSRRGLLYLFYFDSFTGLTGRINKPVTGRSLADGRPAAVHQLTTRSTASSTTGRLPADHRPTSVAQNNSIMPSLYRSRDSQRRSLVLAPSR